MLCSQQVTLWRARVPRTSKWRGLRSMQWPFFEQLKKQRKPYACNVSVTSLARDPFYISRSPHGVSFSHNFFAECFLQNNISGAVFAPRSSCSLLLAIVTSSRAKGGIEGGMDEETVEGGGMWGGKETVLSLHHFLSWASVDPKIIKPQKLKRRATGTSHRLISLRPLNINFHWASDCPSPFPLPSSLHPQQPTSSPSSYMYAVFFLLSNPPYLKTVPEKTNLSEKYQVQISFLHGGWLISN